jgi:hypothetical protein
MSAAGGVTKGQRAAAGPRPAVVSAAVRRAGGEVKRGQR